jgi:hypothetical protein
VDHVLFLDTKKCLCCFERKAPFSFSRPQPMATGGGYFCLGGSVWPRFIISQVIRPFLFSYLMRKFGLFSLSLVSGHNNRGCLSRASHSQGLAGLKVRNVAIPRIRDNAFFFFFSCLFLL